MGFFGCGCNCGCSCSGSRNVISGCNYSCRGGWGLDREGLRREEVRRKGSGGLCFRGLMLARCNHEGILPQMLGKV